MLIVLGMLGAAGIVSVALVCIVLIAVRVVALLWYVDPALPPATVRDIRRAHRRNAADLRAVLPQRTLFSPAPVSSLTPRPLTHCARRGAGAGDLSTEEPS